VMWAGYWKEDAMVVTYVTVGLASTEKWHTSYECFIRVLYKQRKYDTLINFSMINRHERYFLILTYSV
jgi:hypothetical protein